MMLTGPADTRKLDGRSTGQMEIWQEVPRPHEKLTQVYSKSCRCMVNWLMLTVGLRWRRFFTEDPAGAQKVDKSWWKVLWMHGKLTEVDKKSRECTESCRNLTGSPTAIRKVNRWTLAHAGNWQKLTESPANTRKVDGRSHGCTESLWKVPLTHGKFTEVDGRSHRLIEI